MPAELSGGMARRVALARAIALDPMLIMYDEPFAGLDPISLGVVGQLIRKLNDALGITSIVVTHDVYESLKIVDYVYFVSDGPHRRARHARRGARVERSVRAPVRRRRSPTVRCRSTIRRRATREEFARAELTRIDLRRCGASASGTLDCVVRGWASPRASSLAVLTHSPAALRRLQLTMREIYFAGVLSLVIILVSGLFVGMVLALQGYDTLQRYGANESLGVAGRAVAGARARAGGRGAAVRGPRRHADHRRDRPDEGDRAAVGDGDDGGRSDRARGRAALLGRRHLDAAAGGAVLDARHLRRAIWSACS